MKKAILLFWLILWMSGLYAQPKNTPEYVHELNTIASDLLNTNPDSSVNLAQKVLKIAQEIQDEVSIAESLLILAKYYESRGDAKTTFSFLQEALKIYTKYNNEKKMAKVLNEIGDILRRQKHLQQALFQYNQALEIEKKLRRGFRNW